MERFTIALCTWWLSMTGVAAAQPPLGVSPVREVKSPLVKTVAAPAKSSVKLCLCLRLLLLFLPRLHRPARPR